MGKSKVKLMVGGMILVLFVLFFLSCGKKSTNPAPDLDKEAILKLVAEDTTTFTEEITDTSVPDTSVFPKIAGVDTVKFWWRKINSITRIKTVSIYPADSTHPCPYADVTVMDTLTGNLHILARDSSGNRVRSIKSLKDVATRSAYYEKRGTNNSPYRGWSLEGVSGLVSYSVLVPISTRQINQVHLASSRGYNRTFTEDSITAITLKDSILTFVIGDTITLTVTTGDSTDSVYLHTSTYYYRRPHRSSFVNTGDSTFTGSWVIGGDVLGASEHRHAAIDVIKHSTLDGDDPYDSRIWGVIYRVIQ
jgi:hypothetical protein